jgi:hypothetical protein
MPARVAAPSANDQLRALRCTAASVCSGCGSAPSPRSTSIESTPSTQPAASRRTPYTNGVGARLGTNSLRQWNCM